MLADLPEDGLLWLSASGEWLRYGPQDVVAKEGDPADFLLIVVEGGLQVRGSSGGGAVIHEVRAPGLGGLLPFSRMERFPGTVRAVSPTSVLRVHKQAFPEMLRRLPQLEARIIAYLSDRVRSVSRREEERARLAALGRLSAGLAHELNNPAAAASRAAGQLRDLLASERALSRGLAGLDSREHALLMELYGRANLHLVALPPMERSRGEDALAARLADHGLEDPWALAPEILNAGIDEAALEECLGGLRASSLNPALSWLAAALSVDAVTAGLVQSAGRISELVNAVKSYTHMDQAPVSLTDINEGLESTLTVLAGRLAGVSVVSSFDRNIPRLEARGAALNQLWTSLIENAADALAGRGRLRVSTRLEGERIAVEVADDGPGVAETIRAQIFEPFFTTKEVGQGLGLGLDLARRVAREHGGDVSLHARAGETCFVVTLPVPQT